MLATDSGQLTLELVASLIKPIAVVKEAIRSSAKRKYILIHRGLPTPAKDLEQVVEWFQMYGQTEILENQGRFSLNSKPEFDAPAILAGEAIAGDVIQTCYDSRGTARVIEVLSRGDTVLLRLQYSEFTTVEESYNRLWKFSHIEPAPDRPNTTLQEF